MKIFWRSIIIHHHPLNMAEIVHVSRMLSYPISDDPLSLRFPCKAWLGPLWRWWWPSDDLTLTPQVMGILFRRWRGLFLDGAPVGVNAGHGAAAGLCSLIRLLQILFNSALSRMCSGRRLLWLWIARIIPVFLRTIAGTRRRWTTDWALSMQAHIFVQVTLRRRRSTSWVTTHQVRIRRPFHVQGRHWKGWVLHCYNLTPTGCR